MKKVVLRKRKVRGVRTAINQPGYETSACHVLAAVEFMAVTHHKKVQLRSLKTADVPLVSPEATSLSPCAVIRIVRFPSDSNSPQVQDT